MGLIRIKLGIHRSLFSLKQMEFVQCFLVRKFKLYSKKEDLCVKTMEKH